MLNNEFTEYSDFPEIISVEVDAGDQFITVALSYPNAGVRYQKSENINEVFEAAEKYAQEREDACKRCENADEGCVCLNDAYNELMDLLQ